MQVRRPNFDFDDVPPVWGENVAAVHRRNAQGIVPAYIEPFLIKVMRRAKGELDPVRHARLIEDIDIFNKQEAQHYKWHRELNARVRDNGYEGMAEHERRYEQDYEQMLANDSLQKLLAYCEGFESLGLASAVGVVDGDMEGEIGSAEAAPIQLWRWHLAEEWEHRTVAYDVLKALYGQKRLKFYWLRVSGLYRAGTHLGKAVNGLERYLMTRYDELNGTKATRMKTLTPSVKSQFKHLIRVFSPVYDPRTASAPGATDEVLHSV
jgi:predicted metal-dependent hydrolase